MMTSLKVPICVTLWYSISLLETITAKSFFIDYPYPLTVAISHVVVTVCLIYAVLLLMGLQTFSINKSNFKMICALGVLKFLSSSLSMVNLLKLSLSYSQTIKTLQLIISIFLARVVHGEKQVLNVYLSVLCVIFGVAIATVTELSVDIIGILASLSIAVIAVLSSFFSKHSMDTLNFHPFVLLFNIHIISAFLSLPVWLYFELPLILSNTELSGSLERQTDFLKSFTMQGIFSFGCHVVKFSAMSLVTPLSYSFINTGKSVFKIALGFSMYYNQQGLMNILGTLLALFGTVLYNRVKVNKKVSSKNN